MRIRVSVVSLMVCLVVLVAGCEGVDRGEVVPPPVEVLLPQIDTLVVDEPERTIDEVVQPKVTSIQKSAYGNPPRLSALKIDIYVTLEKTKGCGERYWYVTLLDKSTGDTFGTRELFWHKELQVTSLNWNIPSDTEAFKQLQLNVPNTTIFQVLREPSIPNIKNTLPVVEIPEESEPIVTPKPPIVDTLGTIEGQTFELINLLRTETGLQPIVWNDNLHTGAREWSNNMQTEGELEHDSIGVQTYYFAECIYGASWSGYRTPEQTVGAWMNSSGHRAILMGNYRIGAIGIAKDNGFWATYRCKK